MDINTPKSVKYKTLINQNPKSYFFLNQNVQEKIKEAKQADTNKQTSNVEGSVQHRTTMAAVKKPLDVVSFSIDESVYIKCRGGRELRGKLHVRLQKGRGNNHSAMIDKFTIFSCHPSGCCEKQHSSLTTAGMR